MVETKMVLADLQCTRRDIKLLKPEALFISAPRSGDDRIIIYLDDEAPWREVEGLSSSLVRELIDAQDEGFSYAHLDTRGDE